MTSNVTAIIVTYNRKALLERCVRAVMKQTLAAERILVIDNASTDGTESHLRQAGIMDDHRVEFIRLAGNTGGAGGFCEGLKRAYAGTGSCFWLMDDDGVPDEDCLEKLAATLQRDALHYAAPNLLAESGESHFAAILGGARTNIVGFRGGPFNGILISRALVRAVGYPMRNYFIWGDEYEYTNRIQDAGFPMVMVCDAIHRHKSTRYSFARCPRPYHLVRNWIYTIRLSQGHYVSRRVQSLQLAQVIARLLIEGFAAWNFDQIGKVIRGVVDGLNDPLEESKRDCCWGGVADTPQ
jgi:GT2 family glycosyltransferase